MVSAVVVSVGRVPRGRVSPNDHVAGYVGYHSPQTNNLVFLVLTPVKVYVTPRRTVMDQTRHGRSAEMSATVAPEIVGGDFARLHTVDQVVEHTPSGMETWRHGIFFKLRRRRLSSASCCSGLVGGAGHRSNRHGEGAGDGVSLCSRPSFCAGAWSPLPPRTERWPRRGATHRP
jgi:hypothetical protein